MTKCDKCKEERTTFFIRKCNHNCCHECMVSHLASLTSAKIQCPVEGCSKFVNDRIIRECLSNNQINLYDRLSCSGNIIKCFVKDCLGFIAYDVKGGQYDCDVCLQPNCLTCGTLHRPQELCKTGDQAKYTAAAAIHLEKIKRNQIEQYEENDLIPNAESFVCPVCLQFILPRKGVTLRNCLDNFCSTCLYATYKSSNFLNQLVCSMCSTPLKERESRKLIGRDKFMAITIQACKSKFFKCKQADCDAFWAIGDFRGMYTCSKCHVANCIACASVHVGLTCDEFKKSSTYKNIIDYQKKLSAANKLQCFNCHKLLIKSGDRCGSIPCDACNMNTCQFTGKKTGLGGCNCTTEKPCHRDCSYGCIPD